jgi:hypothetical protein
MSAEQLPQPVVARAAEVSLLAQNVAGVQQPETLPNFTVS